MEGKKILITGATGFIGRNLLQRLSKIDKVKIYILVRPDSSIRPIEKFHFHKIVGDIADSSSLLGLRRSLNQNKIEIIIHAAARVSGSGGFREFQRINVQGTRNILEISNSIPSIKRIVYISTITVYGDGAGHHHRIDESAELKKSGMPYADTKVEAEKVISEYIVKTNLPITIVRPGEVLGYDSVWLTPPINLIKSGRMFLVDKGRGLMNFIWIDDLIEAIILVIREDLAVGKSYNITYGETVTFGKYFTDLCCMLNRPKPKSMPLSLGIFVALLSEFFAKISGIKTERTRHVIRYLVTKRSISNKKALQELGWKPRFDYDHILKAINGYLKHEEVEKVK